MATTAENEVYALKFAEHPGGSRGVFFHGPTERPAEHLAVDYFFWLVRSPHGNVVFDVGFTPETAERRQRPYVRTPQDALAQVGVDAEEVDTVVISHLHYDHAGCWAPFTNATFVIQEEEMAFWTGRFLPRAQFKWLVELDDLQGYLRLNHAGRVRFVAGREPLLPGVEAVQVGGHTPGSQILRVTTGAGDLVLASDACAMYENLQADAPFGILTDVAGSLAAFDRISQLASRPELVVPGHDPEVLARHAEVEGSDGLTVRLA